jgi:hypothetical protein
VNINESRIGNKDKKRTTRKIRGQEEAKKAGGEATSGIGEYLQIGNENKALKLGTRGATRAGI